MTALADLCVSVDYGYTASASSDPATGPKFLRITDIVPDSIDWAAVPHCEIEERKRDKFLLDEGDIVVARTGATVGYAKQVWGQPEATAFASYLVRFRPDAEKVDPYYLGQIVQSSSFKRWVKSVAGGAAQPNANAKLLGSFDISLLSRDGQRYVGKALRAVDDLIEKNRRRIEGLEEMARLLYREWFVHFRFPGHGDVKLVDSDLGPIPEGWEVVQVADAFDTVGGGTPSKQVEDYWLDGEVQWFTPTDLTRVRSTFALESSSKITDLGLRKSSAKLFPAGSVMMTSRATIGVISITTCEASTNQGFITCVPCERIPSSYIYFWLRDNVDLFLSLAGGATFKELRKSVFRELPILAPSVGQMEQFEAHVTPMMTLIENLLRQNDVLRTVRDLLLPRLVSGELDVSDLDLKLEALEV